MSHAANKPTAEQTQAIIDQLTSKVELELKFLKNEPKFKWDFGGWINYRYDEYRNSDNNSKTEDSLDYTNTADTRIWFRASLNDNLQTGKTKQHSIYVRFKDIVTDKRPDSIARQGYDHDGPHLDYGYAVLDFEPLWFEVGRRYYNVGQGLAHGNVNDGIEASYHFHNAIVKAFISKSLPHESNIDKSIPGSDKTSKRYFYGIETTYIGIYDQGIYAFALVQQDRSDEDPQDYSHNYTYDSQYYGLGLQGKLSSKMHYWAELIQERGKSHVYSTNEKRSIKAWAGDFGITYDPDIFSHPNITIGYAFGTGDSSRNDVTDTVLGNNSKHDSNFNYFGHVPTGYAMAPRLSNLHFYKTAILAKPLEYFKAFENLSLGIEFFQYFKDKKDGAISDLTATESSYDVGKELDFSLSWQIFSDLTWTVQYGIFSPGKAYPESSNDNENYFSIDLTYMF